MYKVVCRQSPGEQPHATLSISVGKEAHEGAKFAATLEWAARRFPKILICISDSVQRYRLQLNGMSAADAAKAAMEAGEAWARRHADIIAACPVPVSVTRWDMWRAHEDFAGVEDLFAELSVTDALLAAAIERDAQFFLSRNPALATDPQAIELCKSCVIEELAVHTLQARQHGGCRIYPGTQLASIKLVREGLVSAAPYGLQTEKRATITLEKRPIIEAAGQIFRAA